MLHVSIPLLSIPSTGGCNLQANARRMIYRLRYKRHRHVLVIQRHARLWLARRLRARRLRAVCIVQSLVRASLKRPPLSRPHAGSRPFMLAVRCTACSFWALDPRGSQRKRRNRARATRLHLDRHDALGALSAELRTLTLTGNDP
jgi:hypothetical protein